MVKKLSLCLRQVGRVRTSIGDNHNNLRGICSGSVTRLETFRSDEVQRFRCVRSCADVRGISNGIEYLVSGVIGVEMELVLDVSGEGKETKLDVLWPNLELDGKAIDEVELFLEVVGTFTVGAVQYKDDISWLLTAICKTLRKLADAIYRDFFKF